MATLLHVDSSPRPTSSTRRLTAEYVEARRSLNPDGAVVATALSWWTTRRFRHMSA